MEECTKQRHLQHEERAIHTRCNVDEDSHREELSGTGLQGMDLLVATIGCVRWSHAALTLPCVLTFRNDPLIDSHIGICTLRDVGMKDGRCARHWVLEHRIAGIASAQPFSVRVNGCGDSGRW